MKTAALLLILIIYCSCKSGERLYSNASQENINLKYNNVLIYSKRVMGCIGASGPLTYKIAGDTLTVEKKVLPIGTEQFVRSQESVYGQRFKYHKDCLINITTGEAFYSSSFIKKRDRQLKRSHALYVIYEGRKHKITSNNYKRSVLVNLKMEEYNTIAIDVETAYRLYGISRGYYTLQLVKK